MNTISFGAVPVRKIPVRLKQQVKQTSQTAKLKKIIKNGMTIDKLPETGFVVGMILPVPFMSVILTSLGIAIKYSYKTCKWLKEKDTHKLNKLV